MSWIKQTLVVVASGSGGFYLGGRYVGAKAKPTLLPFEPEPQWMLEVKPILYAVLVLFALSVIAWIVFDYTEKTQ